MKTIIAIILTILPAAVIAEEDFLSSFVQGKYLLVGKGLNSDQTYHGKVHIEKKNGSLNVQRLINGNLIHGTAAVESSINGDTKVLRIRFTENKVQYEQTCMIDSDLNNYARISCYLYQPKIRTHQPGLEVLFIDHTADSL